MPSVSYVSNIALKEEESKHTVVEKLGEDVTHIEIFIA
jgi:hypothetical protein